MNYDELVKGLREYAEEYPPHWREMREAADAIEELQGKVNRAIGFGDSAEMAEMMRNLGKYLPDISDPEWQKCHMDMGFYSPLGKVYKEMGLYDEPSKEDEA